jgi:glycosyltransferase involved in cell wall biosynthesis
MSPAISGRPLNILQVLEPSGGGSGRHFVDLCGALARLGHRVTAIYSPLRAEPRFIEELKALGLEAVLPVPMRRAPSPADILARSRINAIVRSHGPFDIIHAHSSKAGALVRLRLCSTPRRIYTPHAFRTMDPTLGKAGRLIYGLIEGVFGRYLSDAVICVSDDEYRHAETSLRIPSRLLSTVVNGVARPPEGMRDAIRNGFGIAPDRFVFGFVGRLSPQKAPERLIEAFVRVARQSPVAELVMIGFGELEGDVRRLIDESQCAERIHLSRSVPGAEAMQAFDALVLPSRYEAMSYVMLEAASAGLPMVLSDVGGASTVVEHGVNGLITANSDHVSGLADAMLTLSSPARYAQFKAGAAAKRDRFGLDRMVQETLAVYQRTLG